MMQNKTSLLMRTSVDILPNLSLRIPTVGEILGDEARYYNLISSLCATPFQYMAQLDDIGVDYAAVSDYDLFLMLLPSFAQGDISMLFGDADLSDLSVRKNTQNDTLVLYSKKNDIVIDEWIYRQMTDCIRKINNLKKEIRTPGNEEARKARIRLERKKQKKHAGRPYEPYLEKLVVALVNRPEFKYGYEQALRLTIYQLNQSFEQIKTSITFEHTMAGIYAGTVDASKIRDAACLSWLPAN